MTIAQIYATIRSACDRSTARDIDTVMSYLTESASLPLTKVIDFHLSRISSPAGTERLKYYLFEGTLIQRNYSALYWKRRNEWKLIKEAYDLGRIDWRQAYAH